MKYKRTIRTLALLLGALLLLLILYGVSTALFPETLDPKRDAQLIPPPGIDVEKLSDRELLEYLAGGYCRWPIVPLKERASHYKEEELSELSDLIIDMAFPLRPESESGLGFLSITDRYLPAEWAYYTEEEGMKKRRAHTQPAIDFIYAQRSPSAKRTPENLEKLRNYYIALDNPAIYPQLRPFGSHCGMGDPDAWNLRLAIIEIFDESGDAGAAILADLNITEAQRHALATKTDP